MVPANIDYGKVFISVGVVGGWRSGLPPDVDIRWIRVLATEIFGKISVVSTVAVRKCC